jgi:dTDP-4-dehydrorhamnose 3,5-epimerase
MLPGVKVLDLGKNVDERGFFGEIFRKDWREKILGNDEIVQANLSVSYPGIIRAWHRHNGGQIDYFLVLNGAIKICAYDETRRELNQIITSSEKLQMIRIPGYYWHGFKNIGDRTCTVVYFVNRLYDYRNPDEERRPWNDPEIIDNNTQTSYDWNKPPYG